MIKIVVIDTHIIPIFFNYSVCLLGNPNLESYFEELVKLQASLGTISTNAQQEKMELSKLEEENKRWEGEVQSFKERESLKTSVKLLEKKRVWLHYKEKLNVYKRLQQNAANLKQQYDTVAARFKPLEDKIAVKEKLILKTQELLKRSVMIIVVVKSDVSDLIL